MTVQTPIHRKKLTFVAICGKYFMASWLQVLPSAQIRQIDMVIRFFKELLSVVRRPSSGSSTALRRFIHGTLLEKFS